MDKIIVKGARQHNLKNIDVIIPKNKLIVVTGPSGSGKSSLAFDTIYAEGQRRYVESLSSYARQFLELMDKPDVDSIEGLSPAISIEQKSLSKNPRSTVGTVTEIYDYLRLLFSRIGHVFCYNCGKEIKSQHVPQIVDTILDLGYGTKISVYAPIVRGRKGEYRKELEELRRQGFTKVRIDGIMYELSEEINLDKNKKHEIDLLVDRVVLRDGAERRLFESIELALSKAQGLVKIETDSDTYLFSENFACPDCGISYPEITPRMFSFNNPYGACPDCYGLGVKEYFDPALIVPNPDLSLREGAIAPWADKNPVHLFSFLESIVDYYKIDIRKPFKELPDEIKNVLLFGTRGKEIPFYVDRGSKREIVKKPYEGVIAELKREWENASPWERERLERFINVVPCPTCGGARLKKEMLWVKIGGLNIHEVSRMTVEQALSFFKNLTLTEKEREISKMILKEITSRLQFLLDVGLDYITLDRTSATLSSGEAQRIRLATQIGSGLTGVLYVLDEPSVGLHQRDNERLIKTLIRLRNLGNTVIVVEHDYETIVQSDYVIDLGPGAGEHGGYLVFQGKPHDLANREDSLTGRYLSGKLRIETPKVRRKPKGFITIKGARANNLKNIDVSIPLGVFSCVTGVSGSGKSTLIVDTLYPLLKQKLYKSKEKAGEVTGIYGYEAIDNVIDIDQSPIGRTPRSNPATYTGVFSYIREIFSRLPESRIRGYREGRFSFNVKGGRCETCKGEGYVKIEMQFLPDVYIVCDQCKGKRYNRDTLEILYKGKSIADVLEMTVTEAMDFFDAYPQIKKRLKVLYDVGLGYIRLGQPATTLSGGEAQRIKLSRELSKRETGRTLYILDEPTTGLHFSDIEKLIKVLNELVERGNTVVVIEHNMDVIKCADYIIDLGPEGGIRGGEVVAVGTPEEIMECEKSYTGIFLKKYLAQTEPLNLSKSKAAL
ncbi:MAG: excinuclease ABC subunit UvrA [Desulfobacterota bacterium]|nr:excinuclease ABC subunit UvrA [Thermodesulfobacteriota bacterium]MDW8001721.1 excinuclease ABC subunit UvrA [Deltaproteobacteria bacterium]